MRLVGREELVNEPWFALRSHAGRARRRARRGRRRLDRRAHPRRGHRGVREAEAAVAPVYDGAGHRGRPAVPGARDHPRVDDPDLGELACRARCSGCPTGMHRPGTPGRPHGADTDAVLAELHYSAQEVAALNRRCVGSSQTDVSDAVRRRRPVLTLLYAPADRPERVAKALASDADVVIVDLEDAVAPSHKEAARDSLASLLARRPGVVRVQVRVNASGSPWADADLAALRALPARVGVRIPKVVDRRRPRDRRRGRAAPCTCWSSRRQASRRPTTSRGAPARRQPGWGRPTSAPISESAATVAWPSPAPASSSRLARRASRRRRCPSTRRPRPRRVARLVPRGTRARLPRTCGDPPEPAAGHRGRFHTQPNPSCRRPARWSTASGTPQSVGDGTVVLADGTFLDRAMVERREPSSRPRRSPSPDSAEQTSNNKHHQEKATQ